MIATLLSRFILNLRESGPQPPGNLSTFPTIQFPPHFMGNLGASLSDQGVWTHGAAHHIEDGDQPSTDSNPEVNSI